MNEPLIVSIWIADAAEGPPAELARAEIEADRGIVGDRYHTATGSFSHWPGSGRAVTLIAEETIAAVRTEHGLDLAEGRSRRNLVTRHIDLSTLLGQTFRIGTAVLRGVRPCEPCAHLERLLGPGTFDSLFKRGGIRADVLTSGIVTAGDRIEKLGPRAFLP